MRLINQLHQIGLIAKMRIDARIVHGVILVAEVLGSSKMWWSTERNPLSGIGFTFGNFR